MVANTPLGGGRHGPPDMKVSQEHRVIVGAERKGDGVCARAADRRCCGGCHGGFGVSELRSQGARSSSVFRILRAGVRASLVRSMRKVCLDPRGGWVESGQSQALQVSTLFRRGYHL